MKLKDSRVHSAARSSSLAIFVIKEAYCPGRGLHVTVCHCPTVLRSGGDDSQLQFLYETEGQNSAFVASLTIFLPTAKCAVI
jgi:hypothetical protein